MFLIDGHNLIHAIRKLDEDFESLNEFQLCAILSTYMRRVKARARIVYDGIGPRDKEPFRQFHTVEVIFSGSAKDADTVIEELIQKNTHPRRLMVVSSDRRLRNAAARRRAVSVKSELFWFEMIDRVRKNPKKPPEPQEKLHGLPEAQVDWWMRLFGLEKK